MIFEKLAKRLDEKLAKEQKKKEKASAHGSKSVMGYYIP